MLRDLLIRLGVSEATAARMPAKWSTLSAHGWARHLVYFLCFVKTLRKEPETTDPEPLLTKCKAPPDIFSSSFRFVSLLYWSHTKKHTAGFFPSLPENRREDTTHAL